jgi:ABC-type transport system involved in multi-copper enzyme maturation permease subunit
MMMQTLAIFKDAYRELNAKKLFWIVLAISGLVVAAFAAVGLNEKGLTVLWWEFPSFFNSQLFAPALFYKIMFANLGVKIWLTWIAAILALVSVASMFPDFISSGSIELSLSKPLGRARLFVTKYLAGLLFVTLQVLVFTTAAYLVIGIRGKAWEEGLFWAVPLTVLCFSYIYALCVLLGLITRSTIASLLLTLLVWFAVFGVHTTENTLLYFKVRRDMQAEKAAANVAEIEAQRTAFEAKKPTAEPAAGEDASVATWTGGERLEEAKRQQESAEQSRKSIGRWHGAFFAAMTVLPKTSETIEILERKLVSDADLEELRERDDRSPPPPFPGEEIRIPEKKVQERLQNTLRSRSVAWVIGTSLAFEAFVLLIAGWIFCRREF